MASVAIGLLLAVALVVRLEVLAIVVMIHVVMPIVAIDASGHRHERGQTDRSRQGCFDKRHSLHDAAPLIIEESFDPPSVQFPEATCWARRNTCTIVPLVNACTRVPVAGSTSATA